VAGVPNEVASRSPNDMTPEAVVDVALRALSRRRVVVVPGLLNRLGAFFAGLFPRWLVARISGRLFRPPAVPALPEK
jgi:uncharacterized protein